jgi:hypothetical protein
MNASTSITYNGSTNSAMWHSWVYLDNDAVVRRIATDNSAAHWFEWDGAGTVSTVFGPTMAVGPGWHLLSFGTRESPGTSRRGYIFIDGVELQSSNSLTWNYKLIIPGGYVGPWIHCSFLEQADPDDSVASTIAAVGVDGGLVAQQILVSKLS